MKVLKESSPGELMLWAKNFFIPATKNAISIGRANFSILKQKKFSRAAVAKIIETTIKNDPTAFGDVIRSAEASRQSLSTFILFNLPPLPTVDGEGIVKLINSFKTAFKYNPNASYVANTAKNAKSAIKNPLKTAKDTVIRRATAGTYTGANLTSYSSPVIGLEGPVVDNNTLISVFNQAKVDDGALVDLARTTSNYYKGAARHYGNVASNYLSKVKNGFRNVVGRMKPTNTQQTPYSFVNAQ